MPRTATPATPALRRLRTTAGAAAAALAATAAALLPLPAASAADSPGCRVDYTANRWTGGYTAAVKVTNLGPQLTSWRLTWTYGGDEHVTSAWNATVTQTGTAVTAVNAAWNGSLATGAATEFGVQGTWAAAAPAPSGFALNGTPCNGGTSASPSPSPSPSASASPSPSASASPSPSGSASPSPSPSSSASPSGSPSGSPSPSTSPTPPVPGCGSAVVCSGFEDQTGSAPAGDWQTVTPNCSGTGTAAIDTAVAYSGTRSLRIDGRAGYCNHVFVGTTKDVSAVGPVVYARMRVRHTTALPAAHVTSLTFADARDGGKDLRIGGQNGALQWNRESDDATLPVQSPAGVAQSAALPTGRWICLRFQIDTTQQAMRTYLDDVEVPGLHLDTVPTQDVDNQWLVRSTAPRPTTFRLGWESYGVGDDTLWFDDVALGASPIAC
ncbi:hydrolase [Kitasatospora sp. NE20-6]|uniref:cellulose-binding domain-containing protein n=1 Tax=Kitasatospora sp. NE20-6 TaxID=2859066 RepID=UPI0034DBEAD3